MHCTMCAVHCTAPTRHHAAPLRTVYCVLHQARAVIAADVLADSMGGPRPGQRPMLAPLSKAEGEAAVSFVSESGDVGVDETFHGKFGERVEDLVVRLEFLLCNPHAYPALPPL